VADGRVGATDGIAKERLSTSGSVGAAGGIVTQRITTDGRVEVSGRVISERLKAACCIVMPLGIAAECEGTCRRIGTAGRVVKER